MCVGSSLKNTIESYMYKFTVFISEQHTAEINLGSFLLLKLAHINRI